MRFSGLKANDGQGKSAGRKEPGAEGGPLGTVEGDYLRSTIVSLSRQSRSADP